MTYYDEPEEDIIDELLFRDDNFFYDEDEDFDEDE